MPRAISEWVMPAAMESLCASPSLVGFGPERLLLDTMAPLCIR